MAITYSRAMRDFLEMNGGKKQALTGGVMDIYDGQLSGLSPDDAAVGNKLLRATITSLAWTSEIRSVGTVTLDSGASGTVDSIKVTDGTGGDVWVLPAADAVTFTSTLTATATAVALAINGANHFGQRFWAYASGAVIYIVAPYGSGTFCNGHVVVSASTTIATTDVNMGTAVTGVASANGMDFGASVNGILAKSAAVLSGEVLVSGYATYFRFTGPTIDAGGADAAPWNQIRLQGSCGTSGADYNMDTTYLVAGATHTIDGWTETLAE